MPSGKHRPGYKRPKLGERRRQRKPLAIDRLPPETREHIQALRATGHSWMDIAAETGLSLYKLRNWYDQRIEQALAEVEQRRRVTDDLVEKWGAGPLKRLDKASLNRLSAEIFEGGLSPELYLRALDSMLKATGRNRQLDLEEGRQSLERDKFEAMKSKGQKLAAEVETAARKGTEVDLKQLAAKVREVYEG